MPYKAMGKWVMKYENGRWVPMKMHDSEEEAKKHAQVLGMHVTRKEGRKAPMTRRER